MKAQWNKLAAQIDARATRERVLIFVAAAAVLAALIYTLLIDPLLATQRNMSLAMAQKEEQIKSLNAQMAEQVKSGGPNSPLRQQLLRARKLIAESDAYLHGVQSRLVEPDEMPGLLKAILE
ncbi:MAG: type II secretion system protein M, partial [Azonexus sp.]|nr:type II secretion system protein M [Azonexus sp.]